MRFFAFLPILLLAPVLFPVHGLAEVGPDWILELHPWFHGIVLEAARWQWIALALMVALSGPVAALVKYGLNEILETRYGFLKDVRLTGPGANIQRSAGLLVAALLWALVLPTLSLPERFQIATGFIIQTVAIVSIVWLVYSIWDAFCDVLTTRAATLGRRTEKLLVPVTRKLVGTIIFVGGLLLALASYGVNVAGVVAGLGVGGLIIALAAKDSVENIFGSLTILFDMPFAIGDWVKIGAVEGAVEEINLRSTRIRTSEDSLITLPNSNLIRASVENLGARRFRRVKTMLSISSQLSSERIQRLVDQLRKIIAEHPHTRPTGYQVDIYEFTMTEIHILLNFFIKANNYTEELSYRGELLMAFKRAAEELGIESLTSNPPPAAAPESIPETAVQQSAPDPGDD